jgi:hypothetical protein
MTVTFSPETEAWIAERKRKGDDPEIKAWLNKRKREALLIDPATAEVDWSFEQTLDPYGTIPDLPKDLQQVGREYFRPTAGERHLGSLRRANSGLRSSMTFHTVMNAGSLMMSLTSRVEIASSATQS